MQQVCRVALVSTLPFKPVKLVLEGMKGRCAAGLFDFEASAGRFITVLAVAVYGFASSDAEARAGALEVIG